MRVTGGMRWRKEGSPERGNIAVGDNNDSNLALVQGAYQPGEFRADALQAANGFVAAVYACAVVAYLLLGSLQFQAFLLDQIVYHPYHLDISGRVQADAGGVAVRAYDRKTALPETQRRGRNTQNFGHFADFIEFLVEVGIHISPLHVRRSRPDGSFRHIALALGRRNSS